MPKSDIIAHCLQQLSPYDKSALCHLAPKASDLILALVGEMWTARALCDPSTYVL